MKRLALALSLFVVSPLAGQQAWVDSVYRSNQSSRAFGHVAIPATTDSFRFRWQLCTQANATGTWACSATRSTGWTRVKKDTAVVTPPPTTGAALAVDPSNYSTRDQLLSATGLGAWPSAATVWGEGLFLDTLIRRPGQTRSLRTQLGVFPDSMNGYEPSPNWYWNLGGTSPSEVWVEAWVRFAPGFKTDWNQAGGSPDYKFLMAYWAPETGRHQIKLGSYGTSVFASINSQANPALHSFYRTATFDSLAFRPFTDGQWHRYRMYAGVRPGQAAQTVWIDDRVFSTTGGWVNDPTITATGFGRITFGANHNETPHTAQSLNWDGLRVWTTDPKWATTTTMPAPSVDFPNEPTTTGWQRALDWKASVVPVNGWTYAPDNGSGLVNYSAKEWVDMGRVLHQIVDGPTAGTKALRSIFPEGMWGIEFPYPQDADHMFYAVPIPQGATSFDVKFKAPVPDNQYEVRIYPTWSGWGDVNWTGYTQRPDGFVARWNTPAPANAKLWVAAGWRGQGPSRVFGPALTFPTTLVQTGHIYVAAKVRTSPGFSVMGRDSLTLSGQKLFYIFADDLVGDGRVRDPGILSFSKRSTFGVEGLSFNYTNQFSDGVTGEGWFWNAYDQTQTTINDGNWHTIEMLITPNHPKQADGTVQVWVDGKASPLLTGVTVFGARVTAPKWQYVGIENPFGGGFARVPREQYIEYAQIRAAVK